MRRLTTAKYELFYDIVLKGMLSAVGMGRFDDVLSRDDAEVVHAFIVHEAWLGFRDSSKTGNASH